MGGKLAGLGIFFFLLSTSIIDTIASRRYELEFQQKQPHIIYILADDLGYNDVGYHGAEIETPNIDKLAEEGVKLSNYYVQPCCTPTRSQLMSGRYQIHTGLQHRIIYGDQPNCLPLDHPTIADRLKGAGYSTHMIGKWHLGYYRKECMPQYRGFDTFYGYLGGREDYYNHTRAYKGHDYLDFRNEVGPVKNESKTYSAHLFTQKAIDQIVAHKSSKPFFLYMSYQSVHGPQQVPDKYLKPYSFIKDKKRRVHAGMVAALDKAVGHLIETLVSKGWWGNTLIVFSTDNGGQVHEGGNNYPLRGWKRSLWEGGMKGVGFVSGGIIPRRIKGTVNNELLHVTDWYPTLMRLAKDKLNDTKLDGFDIWDTITSGRPTPRKTLLHNIDPLWKAKGKSRYPDIWNTTRRAALRVGDLKLITGDPYKGDWVPPPDQGKVKKDTSKKGQNVWLFNITADPNEHHELSESKPKEVQRMLKILADIDKTSVPVRFPDPDPRADPKYHGGVWGPWE